MEYSDFQRIAPRYVDGEASPGETVAIQERLLSDRRAQSELELLDREGGWINKGFARQPEDLSRVVIDVRRRNPHRRMYVPPVIAMAAQAGVLAFLFLVMLDLFGGPPMPRLRIESWTDGGSLTAEGLEAVDVKIGARVALTRKVETGPGTQASLMLDAANGVLLAENSAVRLERPSKDARFVLRVEKGEAWARFTDGSNWQISFAGGESKYLVSGTKGEVDVALGDAATPLLPRNMPRVTGTGDLVAGIWLVDGAASLEASPKRDLSPSRAYLAYKNELRDAPDPDAALYTTLRRNSSGGLKTGWAAVSRDAYPLAPKQAGFTLWKQLAVAAERVSAAYRESAARDGAAEIAAFRSDIKHRLDEIRALAATEKPTPGADALKTRRKEISATAPTDIAASLVIDGTLSDLRKTLAAAEGAALLLKEDKRKGSPELAAYDAAELAVKNAEALKARCDWRHIAALLPEIDEFIAAWDRRDQKMLVLVSGEDVSAVHMIIANFERDLEDALARAAKAKTGAETALVDVDTAKKSVDAARVVLTEREGSKNRDEDGVRRRDVVKQRAAYEDEDKTLAGEVKDEDLLQTTARTIAGDIDGIIADMREPKAKRAELQAKISGLTNAILEGFKHAAEVARIKPADIDPQVPQSELLKQWHATASFDADNWKSRRDDAGSRIKKADEELVDANKDFTKQDAIVRGLREAMPPREKTLADAKTARDAAAAKLTEAETDEAAKRAAHAAAQDALNRVNGPKDGSPEAAAEKAAKLALDAAVAAVADARRTKDAGERGVRNAQAKLDEATTELKSASDELDGYRARVDKLKSDRGVAQKEHDDAETALGEALKRQTALATAMSDRTRLDKELADAKTALESVEREQIAPREKAKNELDAKLAPITAKLDAIAKKKARRKELADLIADRSGQVAQMEAAEAQVVEARHRLCMALSALIDAQRQHIVRLKRYARELDGGEKFEPAELKQIAHDFEQQSKLAYPSGMDPRRPPTVPTVSMIATGEALTAGLEAFISSALLGQQGQVVYLQEQAEGKLRALTWLRAVAKLSEDAAFAADEARVGAFREKVRVIAGFRGPKGEVLASPDNPDSVFAALLAEAKRTGVEKAFAAAQVSDVLPRFLEEQWKLFHMPQLQTIVEWRAERESAGSLAGGSRSSRRAGNAGIQLWPKLQENAGEADLAKIDAEWQAAWDRVFKGVTNITEQNNLKAALKQLDCLPDDKK